MNPFSAIPTALRTQTQARPAEPKAPSSWSECCFLTCSVLPVRMACNLNCKFCFSKSSISALEQDPFAWDDTLLERYFKWSRGKGANRLVVTGGGEPLLRPKAVLQAVRIGKAYFNEIALFTNGTLLTHQFARDLAEAGLSYICFSRHHHDEERNRILMGSDTISLEEFFSMVGKSLKVRATCVLCKGFVQTPEDVWDYIETLAAFGVREFTFKHTYVAYAQSLFGDSTQNLWAAENQIQTDPFAGIGEIVTTLPWGPQIKKIQELQLCYYYEPTPEWESNNRLCRSSNLLADGSIFASLEDQRSRL